MNFRFFAELKTAPQLSSYFIFKVLCAFSLLNDFSQSQSRKATGSRAHSSADEAADTGRIALGARNALAYAQIRENFSNYKRASALMKKYGYRNKWAHWFIDSTCGRQQLKLAAKENGQLEQYQKHVKSANIKWYHIDRSKPVSALFMLEFILLIGAVQASRQHLSNAILTDNGSPRQSSPCNQ